jgi:hypothetical protein
VLYLVSFLENTILDFWGIPIRARVVHDRAIVTLTSRVHAYTSDYGPRHAGIYEDESGRQFWEHPGFAGLASWHMFDSPKDLPVAQWVDEFYPAERYVRSGSPVLADTLNAEASALLEQYV